MSLAEELLEWAEEELERGDAAHRERVASSRNSVNCPTPNRCRSGPPRDFSHNGAWTNWPRAPKGWVLKRPGRR